MHSEARPPLYPPLHTPHFPTPLRTALGSKDAVVEERSLEELCGYPLCGHRTTALPAEKRWAVNYATREAPPRAVVGGRRKARQCGASHETTAWNYRVVGWDCDPGYGVLEGTLLEGARNSYIMLYPQIPNRPLTQAQHGTAPNSSSSFEDLLRPPKTNPPPPPDPSVSELPNLPGDGCRGGEEVLWPLLSTRKSTPGAPRSVQHRVFFGWDKETRVVSMVAMVVLVERPLFVSAELCEFGSFGRNDQTRK